MPVHEKQANQMGFSILVLFPIKVGIFVCKFDIYLGKKENAEFGLDESVLLSLCEDLKDANCYVCFDNFFRSPMLMAKLLENGIYGVGTVRTNRKDITKS